MIAYLSHSLGTGNGNDTVRRQDNIANALAWYAAITASSTIAIVMPWFQAVACGLSELLRPIAYANQLRVLERCEGFIMAGGVVSSHMTQELTIARRHKLLVIDLTDLGFAPPPAGPDLSILLHERESAARLALR